MNEIIYFLDIFSVFICAITGALVAMQNDVDHFGVVVVAAVTGVGGGSTRDLLLGRQPVFWMEDTLYLLAIIIGVIVTLILMRTLNKPSSKKALLVFDAFGLALFTIIGCNISMAMNQQFIISVLMGMVTGIGGGIIRDILCNQVPFVLKKEIYATASLCGALIYVQFRDVHPIIIMLCSMLIILIIRLIALKKKLSLPIKKQM